MRHLLQRKASPCKLILGLSGLFIIISIIILTLSPRLNDMAIKTRNQQRTEDVQLILKAVHEYASHHEGSLPMEITAEPTEICATYATCKNLVDLSMVVKADETLLDLPKDPKCSSENGIGYFISKTMNGRVTVTAPKAEQGANIQITR